MNKKLIPIDLLRPVESILKSNSAIISNKTEDGCYYSIFDKDHKAGYYFKIVSKPEKFQKKIIDSQHILCYLFPAGPAEIRETSAVAPKANIVTMLENWLKTISTFNETDSVYDDPFEKKYQQFYANNFKVVDEDAVYAPFDPDQQDVIELYLE